MLMTLHGEQWQLIIWKSKRWVSMASIWRMYKLPVKEWEKRRVACEAKNAACEKSFPRRPSSLGASFCVHLTSPLSPSLTGTCWPLRYQFVPCALLPSLYSRELSTPPCVSAQLSFIRVRVSTWQWLWWLLPLPFAFTKETLLSKWPWDGHKKITSFWLAKLIASY